MNLPRNNKKGGPIVNRKPTLPASTGRFSTGISRFSTRQHACSSRSCLMNRRHQSVWHVPPAAYRLRLASFNDDDFRSGRVHVQDACNSGHFSIPTKPHQHSDVGVISFHSLPFINDSQPRSRNEQNRGWPGDHPINPLASRSSTLANGRTSASHACHPTCGGRRRRGRGSLRP